MESRNPNWKTFGNTDLIYKLLKNATIRYQLFPTLWLYDCHVFFHAYSSTVFFSFFRVIIRQNDRWQKVLKRFYFLWSGFECDAALNCFWPQKWWRWQMTDPYTIIDTPHHDLWVGSPRPKGHFCIGHFPLGGVAYNSPEFLSRWNLISSIDRMKFPKFWILRVLSLNFCSKKKFSDYFESIIHLIDGKNQRMKYLPLLAEIL